MALSPEDIERIITSNRAHAQDLEDIIEVVMTLPPTGFNETVTPDVESLILRLKARAAAIRSNTGALL
jgi:hypothetical protein